MEAVDNERNTVSRREFVFFENVNRNRPETNVQTLTRTWKLHSVKSLGKGYELYTRNLSCYCDACVNGQNSECENVNIVSNWKQRNLDSMGKSKDSHNVKRIQCLQLYIVLLFFLIIPSHVTFVHFHKTDEFICIGGGAYLRIISCFTWLAVC